MKNKLNLLLVAFASILISCDKDFNTVGSDLIGDENFQFNKIDNIEVRACSKATSDIQTNDLPVNQLGIYNDKYFGKTEANFVTQVSLINTEPNFGTNPELENVVLYVPYFSSIKTSETSGAATYKTDSIFNADKKIKLSVFENGYFLDNLDYNNNFETTKKYYSDLKPTIEMFKRGTDASGNSVANGTRLNNSTDVTQNDEFKFSGNQIIVYKQRLFNGVLKYVDAAGAAIANQNDVSLRVVKEYLAPGMYLELDKKYFNKLIFQNQSNLANNTTFKNIFKGLYFKAEEIGNTGAAMAMINFSQAKILVNYQSLTAGAAEITSKAYQLNLGTNNGNKTVGLLNNTFENNYTTGLNANTQPSVNTEKLYLKGGNGSVAYIELFTAAQLAELRASKVLINDAFLTFYVDQTTLNINTPQALHSPAAEPLRIYIFDAKNKRPLFDYSLDASTANNPKYNKFVHDGILQVDTNKKGVKYRVRITQHLNNVLNSTNTSFNENVRLGLSVTENIGVSFNSSLKNSITVGTDDINYLPSGSVLSPMGTVLHGPGSTNADKKLKLEIYYTKSN